MGRGRGRYETLMMHASCCCRRCCHTAHHSDLADVAIPHAQLIVRFLIAGSSKLHSGGALGSRCYASSCKFLNLHTNVAHTQRCHRTHPHTNGRTDGLTDGSLLSSHGRKITPTLPHTHTQKVLLYNIVTIELS